MQTITARILIVDDSRSVRSLVRQTLERDSAYLFTVAEAANGQEAIRFLSDNPPEQWPDVILLDRTMPVLSGDECIQRLKANAAWQSILVLFMTARCDAEEIVHGLSDLHADAYLTKPFHPDVLLARIKALLRIKQAEYNVRQLNQQLNQALESQQKAYAALERTQIKLAETQAMAVMTKIFEKFVPKQYVQRIAKGGMETIHAGRVTSETLTLLFSDIRAFTRLSEGMTPEALFAFLNRYLGMMGPSIKQNGGFIDKFIGDAIMALFDGPFPTQVLGAARAAIGMQNALRQFNAVQTADGMEPVRAGMGIHIGTVMLGTLGDEDRMDATVIGDAVNLASRLEGLTDLYGCPVIVSEDVALLLDLQEFAVRELDWVVVKGRKDAVGIYELFEKASDPLGTRKRALADLFAQGLSLYRCRDWSQGAEIFRQCLALVPDDKASILYLERCTGFQREPPGDAWTAVFAMHHK
ncbi:MAG: response regulator [Magnetococcales bacterium]|nr:response regulator [Magnetococcales bacterium]